MGVPGKRATIVGVLTAIAAAALLGLSASPAQAHNSLVSSTPAAGSVVTEQPGTFVITTNDTLLDLDGTGGGSAMQVSGPSDDVRYYGDGCASVEGASLLADIQLGQPGEYTLIWQVVSTDGHPVSNEFTFTWAPAAGVELAEGSATPPVCPGSEGEAGASNGSGDTDAANPGDSANSGSTAEQPSSDVFWILGAIVLVIVAGGVTLLALRRKPDDRASGGAPTGRGPEGSASGGTPPEG
ncbi:copper resistance CopC family protein [Compostimonas suwonensis]|uniref:Methionine-rich copper-binding protein CopC n=1 Tax=Compostimonas suwonensis TaxID=1048394 RepID=A0A2M9C4S0_9MICO|nr:copper resistance CopC family protein [Compostimonas suwonensis]PJJ65530.1 methionine-rich copper-binding protein CopC [Compostimonas suwonensis]